jgi:hypothetical protein
LHDAHFTTVVCWPSDYGLDVKVEWTGPALLVCIKICGKAWVIESLLDDGKSGRRTAATIQSM